jgi:hypothetical protein
MKKEKGTYKRRKKEKRKYPCPYLPSSFFHCAFASSAPLREESRVNSQPAY